MNTQRMSMNFAGDNHSHEQIKWLIFRRHWDWFHINTLRILQQFFFIKNYCTMSFNTKTPLFVHSLVAPFCLPWQRRYRVTTDVEQLRLQRRRNHMIARGLAAQFLLNFSSFIHSFIHSFIAVCRAHHMLRTSNQRRWRQSPGGQLLAK